MKIYRRSCKICGEWLIFSEEDKEVECHNCASTHAIQLKPALKVLQAGVIPKMKLNSGEYNISQAMNRETGRINYRNIKIKCPECNRVFAAMRSKHTDAVCNNVDYVKYKTFCKNCESEFEFKLMMAVE